MGDAGREPVAKGAFDRLRVALTTGLRVRAARDEVARGEEVAVTVTVPNPRKLGRIEVGLVCTEAYDLEETDEDDRLVRRSLPFVLVLATDALPTTGPRTASCAGRVHAHSDERGIDTQARRRLDVP